MQASQSDRQQKRGRGSKSKMQILAATEDAIRTLLYVAMEGSDRKISGQEICRTQEISPAFLIKVTRPLVRRGLLRATRGVGGGFELARPPERITLLEVVETIQGPLLFNNCLLRPGACRRDLICPVHPVWRQIRESTENILARWSLADLAASARERGVPWERIHL